MRFFTYHHLPEAKVGTARVQIDERFNGAFPAFAGGAFPSHYNKIDVFASAGLLYRHKWFNQLQKKSDGACDNDNFG